MFFTAVSFFVRKKPVGRFLPPLQSGIASRCSPQREEVFLLQSVQIYVILPSAVFLRSILKEQLRILGSPVQLELRRAKPTGAGGSCAVKIIPLEYDHESEFFRP